MSRSLEPGQEPVGYVNSEMLLTSADTCHTVVVSLLTRCRRCSNRMEPVSCVKQETDLLPDLCQHFRLQSSSS